MQWKTIIKKPATVKLMSVVFTAFVWLLTIFWAIPVAVVGSISNIDSLTGIVPFLSFINDIPPVIRGVVTGLLPVVLMAILIALVPIIMMLLAKMICPTLAAANLKTQGWYFPFQVIQVFLVTTFASGAAAVVQAWLGERNAAVVARHAKGGAALPAAERRLSAAPLAGVWIALCLDTNGTRQRASRRHRVGETGKWTG